MRFGFGGVLLVSTLSVLGIACVSQGEQGKIGPTGEPGAPGEPGAKGDPGTPGADAVPCTVADNNDGTMTITCPGSAAVTVSNGKDGEDGATGQNGSDGKDGKDGVDGKDGTSCSAHDNGDGSQSIDCTDGTHLSVQPPPTDPYLNRHQELPGIVATVVEVAGASNADGTFATGDKIAVTFKVHNAAGRSLPIDQLDSATIWLSGPVTNYQHILPTARDKANYNDVRTAAVYNGDGTYTYTLPDGIPANFGTPLYDTTKFAGGELTGPLTAGTYTVTMNFYKKYYFEGQEVIDEGNLQAPILFNHATTVETHAVVGDANCARCHNKVEGHEGRYVGVNLCATCHTSGAEDKGSTDTGDATNVTIDFKVMLHKLHNAAHLPSVLGVATNDDGTRNYAATKVPYKIADTDFSAVVYPAFPNFNIAMPKDKGYSTLSSTQRSLEDTIRKGITACNDCHGDPDGAGTGTAPADGNRAFTVPTMAACGSCHDDLDFHKPYKANQQEMGKDLPEQFCSSCHTEQGVNLSVRTAHLHPVLDTTLSPEVVVNILGLSGGTGADGKFQAGDRPVVNFNLKQGALDAPLTDFTSFSLAVTGPTTNRQVVIPGALTASPFDFAGRFASPSTSGKGVMGKVIPAGTSVSETLTVEFTSATAYKVTGSVSGDLGTGSLETSTSVYPSGASFSNIVTTSAAAAQSLTLEWATDTTFSVKAGVNTIGTGTLAANTSTTTRFVSVDKSVAFNVVVGTTAYTAGNKVYLSVFKGAAANPVVFTIIAGTKAFAVGDRFYYDFVAPAASYSVKVPMDITLENLGKGDGAMTAANLPVWFGRQSLYEQTAQVATTTNLAVASTWLTKYIYVASASGLAANDYILVDEGLASAEYVQVNSVDAVTGRLNLKSPFRYTHAPGAVVREVTLTFRQEGLDYTLNSTTGVVTPKVASTNPFVMTYRTDGRFGWKRSVADALQAVYFAPLDNTEKTDETWGDWRGKPITDGTYTFALWGYIPVEFTVVGEWQTYRGTTKSARFDALYGAATALTPYSLIETGNNCATCHNELSFHGGGREGGDTCFLCHGTAGAQVHFNTVLHGAHAETFPVKPNGAGQCTKCHGTSDVWESPTNRNHPTAEVKPVRDWSISCTGCHSWPEAVAHTDAMTAPNGVESCETCHGTDGEFAVELMHKAR